MNDDKDIKRIVHYFKSRDEVSALYIFGGLAKNKKTAESDIDIGILVDETKLKRRNFELLKNKVLCCITHIFDAACGYCHSEYSPALP